MNPEECLEIVQALALENVMVQQGKSPSEAKT